MSSFVCLEKFFNKTATAGPSLRAHAVVAKHTALWSSWRAKKLAIWSPGLCPGDQTERFPRKSETFDRDSFPWWLKKGGSKIVLFILDLRWGYFSMCVTCFANAP